MLGCCTVAVVSEGITPLTLKCLQFSNKSDMDRHRDLITCSVEHPEKHLMRTLLSAPSLTERLGSLSSCVGQIAMKLLPSPVLLTLLSCPSTESIGVILLPLATIGDDLWFFIQSSINLHLATLSLLGLGLLVFGIVRLATKACYTEDPRT